MKKCNINILKQHAVNKGGLLLSNVYISSSSKLLWKCAKAHQWQASWENINHKTRSTWYPVCAGHRQPTISELQEYASNKSGVLISSKYLNNHDKLIWEYKEKHQWTACWRDIKYNDTWCPYCSKNIRATIEELQQYANNNFGRCVSSHYSGCKQKILWQCKEGHQWLAKWDAVKNRSSWCPECSCFKTERKVKELLEQKLNILFKKHRVYYDSSNKRKFYEFDGYNEEAKIAFEYHGYQHCIYPNFFNKTESSFNYYRQKDIDKITYCTNNDIKLVIIPYTQKENLIVYIKELNI